MSDRKNGRSLFDRLKPTVGCSANGRRRRRRRKRSMNAVSYEIGMSFRAPMLTELGLSVNCCLDPLHQMLFDGVN